MAQCPFPGCPRIADKSGMCIGHRRYADSFPAAIIKEELKAKEKPYKIPKVAEKRKVQNRVLAKQVEQMKKEEADCAIKSPVCTGKAVTLNHKQKRSPKNLTDPKNQEPACAKCNQFIEDFPLWAKKHGHQISRFVKSISIS